MITRDDVQIQIFKQTAFNTDPASPNGILVPREPDFAVGHSRNPIDNPQVFADSFEREFALGNHLTKIGGGIVPNLNYWPWIQRWLTGELVTTGLGPYTHTSKITKTVVYHEAEVGFLNLATPLFYKFLDFMLGKVSWQIPIEGIWTCKLDGEGSGNAVFAGTTPLDATPTEVTGTPGEYANMTILEGGADPGIITNLSLDVTRKLVWKRPHGKGGKASEGKFGATRISGTIDVYFETDALWLKARNGTLTPLKATLTSGADSLEILTTECKLEPVGPKHEGEDGVMQSFNFRSIKKTDADAPLKLTTINGNAAAAYA